MNALVYVRISADREGAGLGVQRQEADCRELADRLGWNVVDVLVDNDVSAYSGKPRPAYQQLLERLRTDEAKGVLVWHTDRLHRSPAELEEYVTIAETHAVTTQTVKAGHIDLSTASGRMVARQLGAVARYEVEHLVERINAAKVAKARKGEWLGGRRPFGYEADGVTVRPDEAEAVRWATGEILAGASLRSLAADLNGRGIVTSTGGTWKPTELRRVLQRPRNAGLAVYRGEIIGTATWPPLVDVDLWRACNAILSDPARRTNAGRPPRWLGSGIYRCGVCGDPVQVHNNAQGTNYGCANKGHVLRRADLVDLLVEEAVLERLSRPDVVDLARPTPPDLTGVHVEAQGVRERLNELSRMYADGTVDGAQLAEGTSALRGRLSELNRRLAVGHSANLLAPFAGRDPAAVWGGLDLDRRRGLVRELFDVVVHRGRKGRPAGWEPGQPYFDASSIDIVQRVSDGHASAG